MPVTPKELQRLCDQLISCEDEELARKLAEDLRSVIREHVKSIRAKLISAIPPSEPSPGSTEPAGQ